MNLEKIDTNTTAGKEEFGEYRVAVGDSVKDLHAEVAILLQLGYVPQDGVSIAGRNYYSGGYQVEGHLFTQAMWKATELAGEGK